MFVKINDSCIVNTDHIVWTDTTDKNMIVKMSDGTEHAVSSDRLEKIDSTMSIINLAANSAAYNRN